MRRSRSPRPLAKLAPPLRRSPRPAWRFVAASAPRLGESKSAKNRLHFDVCPTDRGEEEELTRLLALGAKRSSIVGSGSWVVLEDPERNEFCLMSRQIAAEPAPFHEA